MNITNVTITSVKDFVDLVNVETYGALGIFLTTSLIMIGYYYLSRKYSMPVSMFLSLSLALPFLAIEYFLGLVGNEVLYLYLLLLSASAVFAYLKKGD
jgi:hypothetical protein